MARPRKMISLEEQIKKQEETVLKVKEKYDSEMMKLKDLYAKRNEEKKKNCSKLLKKKTRENLVGNYSVSLLTKEIREHMMMVYKLKDF